jgi:hypothetical protein
VILSCALLELGTDFEVPLTPAACWSKPTCSSLELRLVFPASVAPGFVYSRSRLAPFASGHRCHRCRLGPPLWFCTTSTVSSETRLRACCIPLPDRVRHVAVMPSCGRRARRASSSVAKCSDRTSFPVTRFTPFEELHASLAVPHHCGLCLPAVCVLVSKLTIETPFPMSGLSAGECRPNTPKCARSSGGYRSKTEVGGGCPLVLRPSRPSSFRCLPAGSNPLLYPCGWSRR